MASSASSVSSKPLFNYEFITRMHDIDAAGVVFFARTLYHAHDAYEDFLNHHKQSIAAMLKADFILPISHTQADFKIPVLLNEVIRIEVYLNEIKEDEFSLNYQFINQANKTCSTALTRHVCLDSKSHQRKTLPAAIVSLLSHK